jgi:hypothetical protein
MARATATFRQSDVTRALRGPVAAGVDVARVEIDARTGNIVITTPLVSSEPVNAYDSWKGERYAR